jgi:hypothetical protein
MRLKDNIASMKGGQMQNQQKDKEWSPYLAGALTGVVMILSV